jgi:hypothetical protein
VRAGEVFQFEKRCRERLVEVLEQARRQVVAAGVVIQVPPSASPGRLPAGVQLEPGRLTVEFERAEDLLGKLYQLVQAAAQDFAAFETATEDRPEPRCPVFKADGRPRRESGLPCPSLLLAQVSGAVEGKALWPPLLSPVRDPQSGLSEGGVRGWREGEPHLVQRAGALLQSQAADLRPMQGPGPRRARRSGPDGACGGQPRLR